MKRLEDIPALHDEIDRLEAEVARLRGLLREALFGPVPDDWEERALVEVPDSRVVSPDGRRVAVGPATVDIPACRCGRTDWVHVGWTVKGRLAIQCRDCGRGEDLSVGRAPW